MVKIVSQNVRGLNSNEKRKTVFCYLRDKGDIICLQETHSDDNKEKMKRWELEWGGRSYWSHGTSASKGVAILIRKGVNIDVINSFTDRDGRVVGIVYTDHDQKYILLNIYAPNDDDPEFFVEAFKLIENYEGKRIFTGDFNVVCDENLDRTKESRELHVKSQEIIRKYVEDTMMSDIWREQNDNKKVYTYSRKGRFSQGLIGSRLDYFLIDTSIAASVKEAKIFPRFRSDHSMIMINIEPLEVKRGRGYWKLNNSVLHESNYLKLINQGIEEVRLSNEQGITANPQELWESVKIRIIALSQTYCLERAENRNFVIKQLEEQVLRYEKKGIDNLTETDKELLSRTHEDLNQFREQKIQGTLFRSKARWHNDGQTASKYLCSLEKNKSASKSMNLLITDSGVEVKDPKKILYHQHQFYKKLYASEPADTFNFKNESKVKILPEIKSAMEGIFTIDELKTAVKDMSRNKTPGLDGLTSEFYVMFFTKLGSMLLSAINHAFTNAEVLHKSALRGVINLIPKRNKDVRYVQNLRPISILCNDYKLIEKMLANRLKPALDHIIDNDQKGFMADRKISSNIRRILDLIEFSERNDIPGIIVSIDFLKCFDRIETHALLSAMEYFGIGPDFQKWTRIIYTNSVSCVANNGHFSDYFQVTRSVKQGGPCSAYFFLLIAEILAIEIRKNPKITGILVHDILKVLGQYADDIDLYLYGDGVSLNEALTTINNFCKRTGFKINYDKTTVYRIGSLRYSNAVFYTKRKVCWTKDSINVLGVEVCTEKSKLNEINYKTLLGKVEAILTSWHKRGLSLMGKVLIVNVLIASLFVYKMTVIPRISDSYVRKLNDMINNFLWQGKRPKIAITDLQASKNLGGMELVDFELKDKSLKASWVKHLMADNLLSVLAYQMLCPTLNQKIWECNLKSSHVHEIFENGFWTEVLQAWAELNFVVPTSLNEILNQVIWYNSCILIANTPFLFKNVFKNGLMCVKQIFENGKLIKFEKAKELFRITQMQWNSLVTAMPRHWIDLIKESRTNVDEKELISNYQTMLVQKKPVRWYYKTILESKRLGRLHEIYLKWSNDRITSFEFDEYAGAFLELYVITNQLVLRSFQYRLLYKAVVLNDKLFRWKIKKNNLCSNCEKVKESVYHFFWECEIAQKLYGWVIDYCKNIDERTEYNISLENVILNHISSNPSHFSNFTLLLAKHYLYVARCMGEPVSKSKLFTRIEDFRRIEKYNAICNNKIDKHIQKWCITQNQKICSNVSGFDHDYVEKYHQQFMNQF